MGIRIKRMKIGEIVDNFKVPPHPSNIILEGNLVRLEPLKAEKLLDVGIDGIINEFENGNDPVFFAIIRKSDSIPVGIASYLRIKPNDGSIEVGHINYSPLLQNTTEGTEAMFLMMKWAFENGYRRYEWKCNALNIKSRNAAQRLGLSYEGVFRQMGIKKGRNRNTAWFAAIDKEWEDLKSCFENYLSDDNFDEKKLPKVSLSSLTRPF